MILIPITILVLVVVSKVISRKIVQTRARRKSLATRKRKARQREHT